MAVKDGVYGGVSAEERKLARRTKLLDATLEVWGRKGGPPVTMTRVCAEAGLTERYFYESFAGLGQAQIGVVQRVAAEIAECTVAALESTPGDPTDRVRAAINAFVQILTDDPRKGRVAIVESASVESVRGTRAQMLREFVDLAAREARELYGPQAWSEVEGRLAATMFIGGLAELVTTWLEGSLAATPDDIVEAATHHFTTTAHR